MAYISKENTRDGIKPIGSNLYGICTSAADAVAKVVSMPDFDVLVEGVTIHIHFQHGNSALNPTLQIGSTAARPIRYNGSNQGRWDDGAFISFTYYQNEWVQNDVQEQGRIYYGEVDSSSTATVFTAQIPGITEYKNGLAIMLKNGVVTSAANFTININGLGAKPVYNNLAASSRETTIFNAAYTMLFVYEDRVSGGDWLCYRGYDANTNTIGYQIRTNSQALPMTSVMYRYRLMFTSADGNHYVPATNSTSTNATAIRSVCQDKINPFGDIRYYGTTAAVSAGSRPSVTNLWQQYLVTLGYSFNRTGAALNLTAWKPIYLKCAMQTDGSAIIDATEPYVQDLPSTEDGYIYIFLGVAISTTQLELMLNHPVYEYKDGAIRPYVNASASGDYNDLTNKPSIEGVTLTGDKTFEDLDLVSLTNQEIESIITL